MHPDVNNYALLERTKYIKLPKIDRLDPAWRDEFFHLNEIDPKHIKLFHVHFGVTFNEFAPLFLAKEHNVIVSFHGADASEYIQKFGKQYYEDLFLRSNLVTVPSEVMKRVLIDNGCLSEKIIVHRYGVDLDSFIPGDKSKSTDKITFLSVARLVEKKGLEYSLKAFAKLETTRKKKYLIIGEGPLENELKELSRALKIDDSVMFLGHKDKKAVQEYMRKADVYVLTSVTAANGDQEGLPVTLIEAHAAGLPIISTNHAGIPELVRHKITGFLCRERDTTCILKYMTILSDHHDIVESMGIKARQQIAGEFDIQKQNLKLSTIYSQLSKQ